MLLGSLLVWLALWQAGPVVGRETGVLPAWAVKRSVVTGKAVDCTATSGEWVHKAAGAEIRVRGRKELLLNGRDASGAEWRVAAAYVGDGGCRFFTYDLDRNGRSDLIFLTANGGSGPDGVTMTVIAFDHLGRPVPWQATGPFALEGDRLLNFVDLDGNRQAELLLPHIEHGVSGDEAVRIALYTIKDGQFSRVEGAFADRHYPIDRPTGVRFSEDSNLTNAMPSAAPVEPITRVKNRANETCWLKGISLEDGGIVLTRDSAAAQECEGYLQLGRKRKIAKPLITVLDTSKHGRRIDIDHSPDSLQQVVELKTPVAFVGWSCETGCRPLIMWARPQQ